MHAAVHEILYVGSVQLHSFRFSELLFSTGTYNRHCTLELLFSNMDRKASSGNLLIAGKSDRNQSINGTNATMAVIEPCDICFVLATCSLLILAFTVAVLFLVAAAKALSHVIRFVLANTLIASFTADFGVFVINITRGIVTTLGQYSLTDSVCRFLLIFISVGGISRPLAMAVFAIVAYIIIKYSISAVKLKYLVISILVMWLACLAFSLLLISPSILEVVNIETTSCLPRSGPYGLIYTVPVTACFIIIPLALNVALLITSFWYVRANSGSENAASLKPMLKFSVFLLLGTLLSTIGHTTPVIAAYVKSNSLSTEMLKVINEILSSTVLVSIIPTPVLVLVYFKPVRVLMKKCLLRLCRNVCKKPLGMSGQELLTERMLVSPIA